MASIKKGAEGPEVTLLQGVLKSLGYDVDIDGKFGGGTESAVKQAQTALGVDADGKVGDRTAAALCGKLGQDIAQMKIKLATAGAKA